ncbi:MAG: GDSL-type esterase/lipase family protein [Myxococcota bacterium]
MPIAKPPGETRILALGDSFTFALGVRFEDLYVQRLERQLNAEEPGRRFQVINAGVAGYNTTQELVFLRADGLRYEPDLVTIGFYWNDLLGNDKPLPAIDGPIRRDQARESESGDAGHLLPAFIRNRLRRSLVLYLGVTRVKNVIAALGQPENELVGIQRDILEGDAEALARYWRATGARLRELAATATDRGIPVLLVSFPMENQVRQTDPSPVYAEALRAEWAPTGLPLIELEAAYRNSLDAGENPYLPYDLHPGPIGMQIAADAIESEIRRQGWLGLSR